MGISYRKKISLLCRQEFGLLIFGFMKKTIVVYGSSTGTCEELAGKIAAALGLDDSAVINVSELTPETISENEALILGSATWGCGELQDDWYDGVKVLQSADLNGKVVALFGCGDSESYGDTFCDAIGLLYQEIKDKGCTLTGHGISTDGYLHTDSVALDAEGNFLGLALDEVNQPELTDSRIAAWTEQIAPALQ